MRFTRINQGVLRRKTANGVYAQAFTQTQCPNRLGLGHAKERRFLWAVAEQVKRRLIANAQAFAQLFIRQ